MSDVPRHVEAHGEVPGPPPPWEFLDERETARSAGNWLVTALSLLFLVSTLLALAVVPTFLDQRVAEVQERIQDVLGPAEKLAAEVELAQAKRLAAVEAFLFSGGETRFRQRYREARRDENRAFEALRQLLGQLNVDVRDRSIQASTLSYSIDQGVQAVLNEEVDRRVFIADWDRERARFDELFSATRGLREALAAETRVGLSEMARQRDFQGFISRLLIIGLLAPLVVLLSIWWRLRTLMLESEALRWAATRARREADALLRATGDGVVGIDREGRCRFLNRAGSELLGYSSRVVEGRDVHDLLHHTRPDGSPYARDECLVLRSLETGLSASATNEILWDAQGRPFPVQISVGPLKDGREVRGAVLTFTDMTEARAAEANLRSAIRARDEVLAIVSHDLRNPVGTIFSAASLLLELELSEEKRREQLGSVKKAAARMNRLIQDLLDVAQIEARALRVAASHFELQELLDEVVLTHREAARRRGFRLYGRFLSPHAEVWGDRDRIHQVLSNLVDNALKFSPDGGVVEVGGRYDAEREGVIFWVSDTGQGIDQADRDRLFDRFFQVSRRDKRGAGLGLSIVKGLVEAHGGEVWVESEEGVGSTFSFLIPDRGRGAKPEARAVAGPLF